MSVHGGNGGSPRRRADKIGAGFNRKGTSRGATACFRQFKEHHTELNDMYWSFRGAASF